MAHLFSDLPAVLETVELAPGLKKEIVRRGPADGVRPEKAAQVSCQYTGKLLDGKTFDSSRTRNKPFIFKIGLGMVIAGWDRGIASMVPGERCVLTCSPEFAYGSSGAGGVIPPNATLAFDVELLSIGEESGGSWCVVS